MTTPPSLHAALRRVIATVGDPDDAAHRAVCVVAEWLRERNRRALAKAGIPADVPSLAALVVPSIVQVADELAGEVPEPPDETEAKIRADERQRCVDYLYAAADESDVDVLTSAALKVSARLLSVRARGLAQGPAVTEGAAE